MMSETPVLIVGGGPVGLGLAVELGWRGVRCTLIEQTDGSIVTPKMNEVNVRTMEFCRRWGIADQVMRCPFPEDWPMDVVAVTRLGGYELGRIERPARRHQRPGPFSPVNLQVCSQIWFDPILRERAQSLPGVRLLYRHRLESFVADAGGVTAAVTDFASGKRLEMRARYLAACDGAGSSVRRALGVKLVGSEALSHSMHLYFRAPDLLRQLGVRPGTFFAAMDRDGFWGNIRAIDPAQGLWRLLFDTPEPLDPHDIDHDRYLRRALAKDVEVEWVGTSQWTRRGVVAERYSDGPIHLVGDAAHQLSPTGALGMNTGIGDAVDLGWKLAADIEGWGGKNLLASYDAERRPIGERNVSMATRYFEGQARFRERTRAIEDATPEGDEARAQVGAEFVEHTARMFRTIGLQIGYRYEASPLCIPDGTRPPADDPEQYRPTTRPGSRAPHISLDDCRSTLDLFGRGFVLLCLGGGAAPDTKALEAAAAARGMPLEIISLHEADAYGLFEQRLVLVRPDGHVAWRGDVVPLDPHAILDCVRGA
jgi:2-polyprenyl-6-methoxyphenol hydroxylase-like FAD-dependent oxidoreductase